MKIALVTPYDYPYPGGVTEHIRHLDREMRALGHETYIIGASSARKADLPANFISLAKEVLPVPFNGSTARISLNPEVIGRAADVLRAGHFDVVHLHEPTAPLLGWAVLNESPAVNVGTFHASIASPELNRYLQPLRALVGGKLDGRILVSRALEATYAGPGFGSYRVIPNGIDYTRFAGPQVAPFPAFRDGRPTILFVGRPEPRKGLPVLLEALARLKPRLPEMRLLVVGAMAEEEKARLLGEIETRGLAGQIVLTGRVSAEDLPRYYRSADLFCAPSLGGESFGIILLEAMAAGLPLVASRIPGYQSVVQDSAEGLLVPPNDPGALAENLIALLDDPGRRAEMSVLGRQKAIRYDWAFIAPRILTYYRELLAGKPAVRPAFTVPASTWSLRESPARGSREISRVRVDLNGWFRMDMSVRF